MGMPIDMDMDMDMDVSVLAHARPAALRAQYVARVPHGATARRHQLMVPAAPPLHRQLDDIAAVPGQLRAAHRERATRGSGE